MSYFDWSCKHDILICNSDGSFSPMDEPFFESKMVAPGTWKILSAGDYSYLVEGNKEAILIDSGYGAGNIREYCEKLVNKPVRFIANTHEHFDHTANNGYFELAYMSEKAYPNATVPYNSFIGIEFPKNYPVKLVGDGDTIPLEGRELEVFEFSDHTPGGIMFLDKKERILFSGDELWNHKDIKVSVEHFARDLKKLKARRNEFDLLCGGCALFDATIIDKHLISCDRILQGEVGTEVFEKKPQDNTPAVEGRIVYDRMYPHPGDSAGKREVVDIARKRCITTDDTQLTYNLDNIFEK